TAAPALEYLCPPRFTIGSPRNVGDRTLAILRNRLLRPEVELFTEIASTYRHGGPAHSAATEIRVTQLPQVTHPAAESAAEVRASRPVARQQVPWQDIGCSVSSIGEGTR